MVDDLNLALPDFSVRNIDKEEALQKIEYYYHAMLTRLDKHT